MYSGSSFKTTHATSYQISFLLSSSKQFFADIRDKKSMNSFALRTSLIKPRWKILNTCRPERERERDQIYHCINNYYLMSICATCCQLITQSLHPLPLTRQNLWTTRDPFLQSSPITSGSSFPRPQKAQVLHTPPVLVAPLLGRVLHVLAMISGCK